MRFIREKIDIKDVIILSIILSLLSIIAAKIIKNESDVYTNINDLTYSIINETDIAIVKNNEGISYTGKESTVNIAPTYIINRKQYNVTKIDENAFSNCETLSEVNLPYSITEIGEYAFYNNDGIDKITIPRNVKVIGKQAFADCDNLKTIFYDAKLCNDLNSDSDIFLKLGNIKPATVIISENVTKIPNYLFSSSHSYDCTNINSVMFTGTSCISIGDYAFNNCNLSTIELPDNIINLGNGVFKNSNIKSIILSNNIKYISDNLFYGCKNLENISIPDGVEIIGVRAFYNSGLLAIRLPSTVSIIEMAAFDNSKIQTINYNGNKNNWSKININDNFGNNFENITILFN